MKDFIRIIRLIKRKKLFAFCILIKGGFNNLGTFRDMFLGLFVNGIYGLFNGANFVSFFTTIVSFFVIMICNYILRRKK